MSTKTTKVQSSLQMRYKTGTDTSGKDIIKKQSFSKVKPAVTDDDVLAIGTAVAAVLKYPVVQILRDDVNQVESV